jgi:hypothetical protein
LAPSSAVASHIPAFPEFAGQLNPTEQEDFVHKLQQMLAEIEEEREWDALVSSPKSQAFLEKLPEVATSITSVSNINDL